MKINKESEYTICCSQCSTSESVYSSDGNYKENDTPSRYFRRQGWRDTKEGENLCPACAKKRYFNIK